MKYKVHFGFEAENYRSNFFYEEEMNKRVSEYDAEFETLEEAVKHAQEYYIGYVCEENTDMYELGYLADEAKEEIASEYRTELICTFDGDKLTCEILEEKAFEESELWNLRKQVPIGSIYLADYKNSYGIPAEKVCDFFKGFDAHILETIDENGENDEESSYYKHDNVDELKYYYENCCCEDCLTFFGKISA